MFGEALHSALLKVRHFTFADALSTPLFIALSFSFTLFPQLSYSNPWVEVGDERTRHHLEFLNDTSAINLPLTSWPLSWADISREFAGIHLDELNQQQLWSYRYIRHAKEQADRPLKTTKRFYGSNSISPFTHFASESRDEVYANSETTILNDYVAVNIEAHAVRNPLDNDEYRFDGSYVATKLGNWTVGLGAIERWWGPGWQSSLLLSNHARPAPGIFLRRNESLGINLPILSLLGPWSFKAFANRLEEGREIPNARLIGARVTVTPTSFLELSHSRLTLRGGDTPAPLSDTESSVTETPNTRRNHQNIGYDIRISLPLKTLSASAYGQRVSNQPEQADEAESAMMAGIELGGAFGPIHNRIAIEYSDTENDNAPNSVPSNNPIYGHPYYTSGYRHYGRTIGESAGTNALKVSALGDHYFENGVQLSWRLSQVELNQSSSSENMYTASTQEQKIAEASIKIPLSRVALINAGGFYLTKDMMLADTRISSGAYVQLELRF